MNEFYPDLVRAIIVLGQQEDRKSSRKGSEVKGLG